MHILSQLIGALVEAWGEVKVQKARVILSLVGVVAAVGAMTTVIALGDLTEQSFAELHEAYEGRATTLHITVYEKGNDTSGQPATPETQTPTTPAPQTPTPGRNEDTQGRPLDRVGDAMTTIAQRFKIPYWSHQLKTQLDIRELQEAYNSGQFRGKPIILPEWGGTEPPSIIAVDPPYQVLYRLKLLHGRWIHTDDWKQRVAPVVINSEMWNRLGQPNIADPIILHTNDDTARQFRIVGVVKTKESYASPAMYVSYEAWKYMSAATQNKTQETPEMLVWVGDEQYSQARQILPQAVASALGPNWEGNVVGGENRGIADEQNASFNKVIMIIGAIVIFLGALGLLNVAIVTVRQRIREIGIRRAMGASAGRVFFAVFMESVVATFVAGIIGVAIAILIIRFMPLEYIGIGLQERPGFPLNAAFVGVAISTAIGALCGIIPATAAVRVRPIDAIRY